MPALPDTGPVVTVLLIDANAAERRLTADVLTVAGMRVIELEEGRLAVERAGADPPDLIVLDTRTEGIDGLELCRRLRAARWTAATPLLILSVPAGGWERALALEAGADDYVAKPFNVRELVARARGLLRRRQPTPAERWTTRRLTVGPLSLDVARREVTLNGLPLRLTHSEFSIMLYLAECPGRVCTREEIAGTTLDIGPAGLGRAVDAHVAALRRKLGSDAAMLETVRGTGYRLSDLAPASPPSGATVGGADGERADRPAIDWVMPRQM